jgi:hypothetical protein
MSSDTHFSTVKESPSGELYVILPEELVEDMDWEVGDEIEWAETEVCNNDGEILGLTLVNVSKEAE